MATFYIKSNISNVFIHMGSHASWWEMENDVYVIHVALLTKQWRWFSPGAICNPLNARNVLNISEKSEQQYSVFNTKLKVDCFWWCCIDLLCDSVCQLCIFTIFLDSGWQRKMDAIFILQAAHIAKVVLAECASLIPCNIKELSLTLCNMEIINASWMGQFLGYIITYFYCLNH